MRDKLIELIKHAKEMREADAMDIVRESECDIFDKLAALRSEAEYISDHLIANGVTVQEWIPVSERLPEDGESVYAWVSSYGEIVWVDDGAWRSEYVNDYEDGEITHWMPLPEPPKGE